VRLFRHRSLVQSSIASTLAWAALPWSMFGLDRMRTLLLAAQRGCVVLGYPWSNDDAVCPLRQKNRNLGWQGADRVLYQQRMLRFAIGRTPGGQEIVFKRLLGALPGLKIERPSNAPGPKIAH